LKKEDFFENKFTYAQFNFLRPAPVINDYDSMKNNSQFINAAI